MDYQLAKQLKDTGFKSEHQMDMDTGQWCVRCPWDESSPEKGFEDMCFPTLEELIEACGEKFGRLEKGFIAYSDEHGKWRREFGKTPLEAVVRLYLTINKK